MNVVTYCRVSSEEQAQRDLSVPAQRKALQRWIADQPDCRLLESFVDEGISAYAPADKRPGLCAMIAFCRKNPVDFILVHKLDRFSRNREESILFKSLLRKHGVSVKSITENFDPETPQGFLYEGMIEVINQFYSMNLATETMKGMRENADRGYRNGGSVPYGYRAKKVAGPNGREHTVLEPGDPERVTVIQEIFRRAVVEGASVKAITNSLNERRVPAPRGRWWNCSTIGIVLNNRAYVGDTVWNKKNAKRHQRKPAEQLVVMENTHEPLVDRELFLRRKKLADAKTFGMRTSPHRHVPYLLSRLMRCSNCGAAFVGRGQRTVRGDKQYEFHRYYCASYLEKGTAVCGALSIRRDWIEGEVLGVLRQGICSPERLATLEQLVRQKIEERRKRYCRDPRELQRRLDGINLKIKNYYQAIGEGLDAATCKERIAALEEEKAEVETEAELLNQDDYYRRALEMNVEELRKFASAFDSEFTGLPFHVQRQVVLHFIERIEVIDRELVRITVKVPFDNNGVRRLTGEVEAPSPEAPKAASQAAPSAPVPVVQVGPSRGPKSSSKSASQSLSFPSQASASGTAAEQAPQPTAGSHASNPEHEPSSLVTLHGRLVPSLPATQSQEPLTGRQSASSTPSPSPAGSPSPPSCGSPSPAIVTLVQPYDAGQSPSSSQAAAHRFFPSISMQRPSGQSRSLRHSVHTTLPGG